MGKYRFLPSSITNLVIEELITQLADKLTNADDVTLGQSVEIDRSDVSLKAVVWGFTRDASKLILEVIINAISVAKVVVDKRKSGYRILSNPRYVSIYKRYVGQE